MTGRDRPEVENVGWIGVVSYVKWPTPQLQAEPEIRIRMHQQERGQVRWEGGGENPRRAND